MDPSRSIISTYIEFRFILIYYEYTMISTVDMILKPAKDLVMLP